MEESVFSNKSNNSLEIGTVFLSKDKRIPITSIHFRSVFLSQYCSFS